MRRKAAIVGRQEEELAARAKERDEAAGRARTLAADLERATADAGGLGGRAGSGRLAAHAVPGRAPAQCTQQLWLGAGQWEDHAAANLEAVHCERMKLGSYGQS